MIISNNSIRKQLDEICKNDLTGGNEAKLKQINEKNLKIEKLLGICPEMLNLKQKFRVEVNCHAFSLGFWKSELYFPLNNHIKTITSSHRGYSSANHFLMKSLVENEILSESTSPKPGDLILYYDDIEIPTHSGILENINNGNVIIKSKWGNLDIFKHSLWDIPESYGSNYKYYKLLTSQQALTLYETYHKIASHIDNLESIRIEQFYNNLAVIIRSDV